jgi:hypothetical protein
MASTNARRCAMKARRVRIGSSLEEPAVDHRRTRTRPTRVPRGRLLWIAGGVAVTLLGIYVGALALLGLLVDPPSIASDVASRASAALNRQVDAGDAGIYLLPRPGLRISDVRIESPDGYDGAALALFDRVRLDISPLALLRGRIEVNRVRIDGPRVNLGVDDQGVSNFGDLVPQGEGWGDGRLVFAPREVMASRASVAYFDAPATRSFVLSGASIEGTVSEDGVGGWTIRVGAVSDSLHAMVGPREDRIVRSIGPNLTLTIRGDATGERLEIQDGLVEHMGTSLSVSGRVADLDGPTPSLDLQFTSEATGADVLTPLLPDGLRTRLQARVDGTLGVALRVRAKAGAERDLTMDGDVRLSGVGLRLPGGGALAERIDGVVAVSPQAIVFDSMIGVFSGGPFELSGTVGRPEGDVTVSVKGYPDIDTLDRLGLSPSRTTLSGDMAVDLSIEGSLGAPEGLSVVGSATVEGLQAKHDRFGVPLYIPRGTATFEGRDATWSQLTVLLGEDRLLTDGRVHDPVAAWLDGPRAIRFDASVRGPHIDLNAILPQRRDPPEHTYGHIVFAHLGGRDVSGRPPAVAMGELGLSRPKAPPVRGALEIAVDTVEYRRYRITSLATRVDLSDEELSIADATFEIWDGRGDGNLQLGIGDRLDEPFELTAELAGVNAKNFLSTMTPLGESVAGTLDLDLEVSGTIDTTLLPIPEETIGRGHLAIDDGSVAGTGLNMALADFLGTEEWLDVAFTSWSSEFEIGNGALRIDQTDLDGELGQLHGRGSIGLGGQVDLSVALSIPSARLGSISLRRTGVGQSVLDDLSNAGRPLELGVRVGGSLEAAILEPDAGVAEGVERR